MWKLFEAHLLDWLYETCFDNPCNWLNLPPPLRRQNIVHGLLPDSGYNISVPTFVLLLSQRHAYDLFSAESKVPLLYLCRAQNEDNKRYLLELSFSFKTESLHVSTRNSTYCCSNRTRPNFFLIVETLVNRELSLSLKSKEEGTVGSHYTCKTFLISIEK